LIKLHLVVFLCLQILGIINWCTLQLLSLPYKRKCYGDLSDDQTTIHSSFPVSLIMSASSSNDAKLLRRIEKLLEQDPQGQDAALSGLLQELGTLWDKPATETLEKAFQLFGTAAGKHSKNEERDEVLAVKGSG
jgi:hypothetical protein